MFLLVSLLLIFMNIYNKKLFFNVIYELKYQDLVKRESNNKLNAKKYKKLSHYFI